MENLAFLIIGIFIALNLSMCVYLMLKYAKMCDKIDSMENEVKKEEIPKHQKDSDGFFQRVRK